MMKKNIKEYEIRLFAMFLKTTTNRTFKVLSKVKKTKWIKCGDNKIRLLESLDIPQGRLVNIEFTHVEYGGLGIRGPFFIQTERETE